MVKQHRLHPTQERFLRRHEVELLVGLQRSSIYRLMNRGEFPRPFRLTKSGQAVGWKASDITLWLASRVPAESPLNSDMQTRRQPSTMADFHADGSDHVACHQCGYCETCGDCAALGCRTRKRPNDKNQGPPKAVPLD